MVILRISVRIYIYIYIHIPRAFHFACPVAGQPRPGLPDLPLPRTCSYALCGFTFWRLFSVPSWRFLCFEAFLLEGVCCCCCCCFCWCRRCRHLCQCCRYLLCGVAGAASPALAAAVNRCRHATFRFIFPVRGCSGGVLEARLHVIYIYIYIYTHTYTHTHDTVISLCIMYYVLCVMCYVLCVMYYVLRIMHYVLCIMHCVLCMLYYILCHVMLCYVMSCHVMLCYVISRHVRL